MARSLVMRMPTAARDAVPSLAPGEVNVEYVAMDGTLHAVPLAEAARVRPTDMQPSRRFKARKARDAPPRAGLASLAAPAAAQADSGYREWLTGRVAGRSGRRVRRAGPGPRLRRSAGRSLGPGAGGPRPGWRGRWPGRSGPGRSGRAPRSRGWRRRGPVGLENTIRVPSGQAGGEVVLVGESAEDLLAPDPALGEVDRFRRMGVSLGWGQQAQGTVRPGSVVRASCHDPAFHPARPHGAPDHTGRPIGP